MAVGKEQKPVGAGLLRSAAVGIQLNALGLEPCLEVGLDLHAITPSPRCLTFNSGWRPPGGDPTDQVFARQ
jgi:hypothetical protein